MNERSSHPASHTERRRTSATVPEDYTEITLFSGDCRVANKPNQLLTTILGSCVSACMHDPVAKVGGMNHFLLPATKNTELDSQSSAAARYGAYAMEQLINQMMKHGAVRSRLQVKVFGGGNVMASSMAIGHSNAEFVREYLRHEGLSIVSEDLGGSYPRRVHFYPDTGKVMVRRLQRRDDLKVVEEEQRFAARLQHAPVTGEVDLF